MAKRAFVPALAGLFACAPLLVHAAGFDCSKAASKAEKTICADPVLSDYDSQLSRVWRTALKQTRHAKELKADQQAWLKQRDQCEDWACLRSEYTRRLAMLAPANVAGTFVWDGAWSKVSYPQVGADLRVQALGPGRYRISLSGHSGANAGEYSGEARASGNDLRVDDRAGDCQLILRRTHRQIEVEQVDGSCGAGAGVYYAGRYTPGTKALPARWDLLNRGLVRSRATAEAIRRALGSAYDELLGTLHTCTNESSAGITTNSCFVRGLGNGYAAVIMEANDGRWWLAYRGDSEETRYYTDVAVDAAQLPAALRQWHDELPRPLRLMSATGRPLSPNRETK
jgi:uncharacterized protein